MDDLPKLLALLLTLAAILPHIPGEIPRREVESATAALRTRGYNLFGNSLTVSDLLFQVLAGDEFTFLSPPDTSLFSLGMSIDSFRYVHSLRLHVIPRRLSISDLRNLSLSSSPSAATVVPSHSLFLSNLRRDLTSGNITSAAFDYVVVNGIRISSPDIFLGPHIAVHGLDGTLAADSLPPETFHGDLGLSFTPPPAWPPSEIPYPDPIPPSVSPDFEGISPIFPYPDLPPPIPMVPYPISDAFANSPQSAHLTPASSQISPPVSDAFANSPQSVNLTPASSQISPPVTNSFANPPESVNLGLGSLAPVGSPPATSTPPKIAAIPSPWSSTETGQAETGFRPSVQLPPPQAPPNPPPRIWGAAPPPYQQVWKNYPNNPWRKPKGKKSNKKLKRGKGHHHRKHKGPEVSP